MWCSVWGLWWKLKGGISDDMSMGLVRFGSDILVEMVRLGFA